MLRNTRISTKLIAMAAVPIVLVALLAAVTLVLVRQVSINSPAYDRIITSKNFVAEVQTPRLFLAEANMYVHQLVLPENLPGDRVNTQEAVQRAQINYEEALEYWKARVTDPKEQEHLLESDKFAQQYFKSYEQVKRLQGEGKDAQAVALVQGKMADQFLVHKAAIENVVGTSEARIDAEEVAAAATTRRQLAILAVSVILLIALSSALGYTTVRSITSRIRKLSHVATVELPEVIDKVKRSTLAGDDVPTYRPIELGGGQDELSDATHAFNAVLGTAVELASQQSRLRRSTSEMFVNLGRRNHKLLSRTLSYISELERDERDPATLQKLFKLDHLSTRMRRHAESLLVLAGSAPLRTWSRPVPVGDVLRAALSEIEAYDRVDVSSLEPIAVKGSAVSDLAHLMAELLENATTFSPPHTRIRILGRGGSEGYTLVVVDEGVGMKPEVMATANRLIAAAERDDSTSIGDARMLGLGVVGRLAARHGLSVNLGASPMGGVVAWVVLPQALLSPIADPHPAPGTPAEPAVEIQAEDVPRPVSPSPYAPTANGGPPPISQPIPIAPAAALPPGISPPPASPMSPPAQRPSPDTLRPPLTPTARNGASLGPDRAANGASLASRGSDDDAEAAHEDEGRPAAPAGTGPVNGQAGLTPSLPQRRPGATDGTFADPTAVAESGSPFLAFEPRVQPAPGHEEPYRAAELFTPATGVPSAPVFEDNPYGRPESDAEPAQGIGAPLRKRVRGAQMPEASELPADPTPAVRAVDRTADSVRSALSSFVAGQRSAVQATPADGLSTNGASPGKRIDLTEPQAPTLTVRRKPEGPATDSVTLGGGSRPEPTRTSGNGSPLSTGIPTAVRVSTSSAPDGLAVSLPVSPLTPGATLAKGTAPVSPTVAPAPAPAPAPPPASEVTNSGLRRRVRGAQLPEMTLPPVTARPADRTAESVRAALANFTAGRRSAVDSSD